MATYTYQQLYGTGSIGENLAGTKTFTFTNPSASSYFTMETVRNNNIIDIVPQLKEELRFRLYGKLASEYK
jgi:hypothetical protein